MLHSPNRYTAYQLLEPFFNKVKPIISKVSVDQLDYMLVTRDKDNYVNETSFLVKSNSKESFFVTNNSFNIESDIRNRANGKDINWIYLNLYDKNWSPETKIYPEIENMFKEVIEGLRMFPGLTVGGLHFSKPFSLVPPHVDFEPSEDCMNLVMVVTSNNAVMKLGEHEYTILEDQMFIFDASIEHSIENFTDKEFIVITLRIDSNVVT